MFRFENLEIWQMAIEYAKDVYIVVNSLPKNEQFGIGDQLRRAAVSISNNIAEGSGGTDKDFSNYLDIAVKSTLETVSCLHLAQGLGYIDKSQLDELYNQAEILIKRIRAFKNTLKQKSSVSY
ncbi:MAG: four helix bundle protein [Patescibacteria group bacterium]